MMKKPAKTQTDIFVNMQVFDIDKEIIKADNPLGTESSVQ